ncbi:hypothetical protein ATL41_1992 [Flavimobilis soli]|uniref:Uncharacterized protein n=1 Tax=Flavimobilis soli TaxID=442709 RepID=A0A2A9EE93_9MICO|nr:hypothetical protein [Flavimobilis soli]PFG37238.1 hypothetical protein ATL41_1992 [Flavimobilis soli]
MHQIRPGIVFTARGPRRALWFLLFFALLALGWSLSKTYGAFTGPSELLESTSRVARWTGWELRLPTRLVYPVGVVASAIGLRCLYVALRTGTSQHGFVDYEVVPTGLRIIRSRMLGRARSIVVPHGQHARIHAVLTVSQRGGIERYYRFTFASSQGSFTFQSQVHVETLSLASLEEAADQLGITLETTGAATEMQRRGSIPPTELLGRP